MTDQDIEYAVSDLRPFVNSNEYQREVTIKQSNLDDLQSFVDAYEYIELRVVTRDFFDVPPSVTVRVIVDLDTYVMTREREQNTVDQVNEQYSADIMKSLDEGSDYGGNIPFGEDQDWVNGDNE